MSSKFYYRIHDSNGKRFLAICDSEVLDKIEEKYFYFGNEVDEHNVKEIIGGDYISINALGGRIVKILIEEFQINEKLVKKYKNIPHLIIFFL